MNNYEYTTKTIPKNRRILVSTLILLGTLLLSGYVASLLLQGMEEGLLSGKQNLYFFWSFPTAILVIGFLLSFYHLRRKKVKELTPESEVRIKEKQEKFYSRWYVRYFGVVCGLVIAFVSYISYTEDIRMHGLGLLAFNPVTGVIASIIAIFGAWELSLIAIIGAVLYFTYLGIAALPVSVAIIIGSIIIAYGVIQV